MRKRGQDSGGEERQSLVAGELRFLGRLWAAGKGQEDRKGLALHRGGERDTKTHGSNRAGLKAHEEVRPSCSLSPSPSAAAGLVMNPDKQAQRASGVASKIWDPLNVNRNWLPFTGAAQRTKMIFSEAPPRQSPSRGPRH